MLSYLRNTRFLAVVGLLVLAAILGMLQNRAASEGRSPVVEDAARMLLRPFQVAGASVARAGTDFVSYFRSRSSLRRENRMLREEVRRLTAENAELRDAAEENVRLRQELGFKSTFPLPLISARVIARVPSGWFSTCIIDRGTLDGVQPGCAVATFRGLVGQVQKASPTSSTVLMLSDSSSSVGGIVQRSRVNGICQGQNADTLLLNYLAAESDVKVGDLVVSSGIGQLVPKGLLIGRIVSVKPDPGGFTKHALVRPSVRFDQLEDVSVVVRRAGK